MEARSTFAVATLAQQCIDLSTQTVAVNGIFKYFFSYYHRAFCAVVLRGGDTLKEWKMSMCSSGKDRFKLFCSQTMDFSEHSKQKKPLAALCYCKWGTTFSPASTEDICAPCQKAVSGHTLFLTWLIRSFWHMYRLIARTIQEMIFFSIASTGIYYHFYTGRRLRGENTKHLSTDYPQLTKTSPRSSRSF